MAKEAGGEDPPPTLGLFRPLNKTTVSHDTIEFSCLYVVKQHHVNVLICIHVIDLFE